jgi:GNAT superfamily N-acetyltransferase
MVIINRVSPEDPDFVYLVGLLDKDLLRRYPRTQHNYVAHNVIMADANSVIAYEGCEPVGCGCFRKAIIEGAVEIKRMYVAEPMRGKGIARAMLHELENWAVELGWHRAVLETGISQPEALSLYAKAGYLRIDSYGPYAGNNESICMGKVLSKN